MPASDLGEKIRQILQGLTQNVSLLGPPQQATDQLAPLGALASQIKVQPHPQGFWQSLAPIAKTIGQARLTQLGGAKEAAAEEAARGAARLKAEETQAGIAKTQAETAALGEPKTSVERLRKEHPDWSESQILEELARIQRGPERPPVPSFEEKTYEDYLQLPEAQEFGPNRIGYEKYKLSIKPKGEPTASFEEMTYQDYLKNPASEQFGKDRTGYERWKISIRPKAEPIGGLNPQQHSAVQSMARQFDQMPLVRAFNETANRFETVKGILGQPLGGPGDLATIFEFMKALDPNSVVRESEYETAARSGNIFRGWAAEFNGYLNPHGGFLPPEVKADFLKILGQKLQTSARQVKGIYEDFGRRIDQITGEKGTGTSWLTDYTSILAATPETGGAQTGGGRITVQIPGQPEGQIDASQWEAFKKKYPNAVRK